MEATGGGTLQPRRSRSKKEIRNWVLEKRKALGKSEVNRLSSLIIEKLQQREEFRRARVLLAYAPIRNEVDIGEVLRNWPVGGRVLLLPAVDWQKRDLWPVRVERYPEGLVPGRYGILEPSKEKYKERWSLDQINLVLVPGVAFDVHGFRLGYGQGFYDRFLRRLSPEVKLIGLAYDFQVLDDVYPEPHDIAISTLITERRTIENQTATDLLRKFD